VNICKLTCKARHFLSGELEMTQSHQPITAHLEFDAPITHAIAGARTQQVASTRSKQTTNSIKLN